MSKYTIDLEDAKRRHSKLVLAWHLGRRGPALRLVEAEPLVGIGAVDDTG